MQVVAAVDDEPKSSPDQRRRIGPFVAGGRSFLIESPDTDLLATIDDALVDLRSRDNGVATPVMFTIERNGPAWLTHPWALWRDGEACETTVTGGYIVPYVLWEVTRLVLEAATAPVIPIHAAALVRNGRALVLCGPSHAGKSTLSAWLTHRGWDFLTDEVALLDVADPGVTMVRPFWRPIGVRRGGPIDAITDIGGDASEALVAASRLGRLGHASPLVAIVCPQYSPDGDGVLAELSPAAALATVAAQLPSLPGDAAHVFHAVADVVTRVPAFTLAVDDLDVAEAALAALVDEVEPLEAAS